MRKIKMGAPLRSPSNHMDMITITKKSVTVDGRKYKTERGLILDVPSCLGKFADNHVECKAHLPGFDEAETAGYLKRFKDGDGLWRWHVVNRRS